MLIVVKLWNYLRGYVMIKIEGLALEKFINYAIARGIYLWDIVRIDYTTLEAKVGLEGYKELRHIVKKSGCKIKINMRIGYPFFMHKIKMRKMFIGGFVIFFLIIFFSTSFIWNVEVVGNEKISKPIIYQHLKKLGLYPGVFKYKLDISHIENGMMIQLGNLAWAGIQIKGTKAIVEIVEKVSPPPPIPNDIPCDIVASKKGIIEKVIAKNGDALVQKGDIVKKGQILISGTIVREELDNRYVHALGEVYAKTYYEEKDEIPLVYARKIKTGNKRVRRIFKIGNNQIISSLGEIPYKNVIIEKRSKTLSIWRNIKIPVEIIIEEHYEVIEKKEKIPMEIAKEALKEKMMVKLANEMPQNIKIIRQDMKFDKKNNQLRGKATVEVLEQIGTLKKLIPIL